MLSKSFKAGKCKTSLKLAVARIKLLKNKRDVQVKQMRRDLAQLLETGKDQTARIRVEHVIREEKTVSAYELIELYCELIVARLTIIESQKSCPIDLREAICSVIFASPRCADLPELLDVRKHFIAKYGKEFATSALELRPDCGVSRLIVEKLSAKAPDIETKIKVLTAIAEEHNIKWEPKAFEEQVQKPSEDLLKGPSSFTYKIPVESSTVQFPPPSADKHKSVTKHTVTDVDRSSFGSNSFSSPALVDTASQPGPRAAASTYDRGETGHTHFREEVASSTRQKWNMEFKDATSAAQAAAESAERASMAARAAAELASRENDPEYSNRSRDSSKYRSKHEAGNLMGSKFQGVAPTRDSVRSDHNIDEATYATKQRMRSMESQRVQDHIAGDPKSVNEDSKDTRSLYGRNASSASTHSSSEKGSTEDIWRQKKIVEDESSGEEFAERHPIRPVSSSSSNHSYDGDVSISDLQNSDRYASESFFKVDPINRNMSQRIDASDTGRGQIERKSSKSVSSHSTVNSIDHEKVLDSVSSIGHEKVLDSPVHENYASQHSLFGSGKEINQDDHKPGLSVDAPAFDQSDGESDEHAEFENFMEKDDSRLTSRHTEANFHVPSSNMDYSALDQLNNNFRVKDGSSSSMHSVSRLQPAEVSGVARRDDPSPQSNAVAYDVSDGASSDTEDEMIGFGDRGDTVSHSLHNKKNAGKYEHPQSLSRSSLKDTVTMDKLDQFSSSCTDATTEFHSSDAGGHELNFGRLSGGFRNKGFIRPPYLKSTVVDESLPSETSTDDSSKKPSPKTKMATFVDAGKSAHNYKPHFRSIEGSRSRNSIDSDDGVEDLEQHPASGSRPYHTAGSTLSTTKLDGKLSIGNKEKASSTLMRPESNEISQEKPHRRSSWRTSKESGHASVVACVDEDIEKQTLSPVGRDTSPILSGKKLEGAKTAVPSTTRISGVADIYDNKTSVRTSKGPISTAASFFDEVNDKEDVFKPRDVAANLGIRSGRRLSQRTKDSKAHQLSNSGGSSDLESKSLRSTSSISETSSKPSTSTVKPEKNRTSKFLPPEVSVEQHPTCLSEAEVLVQKDRLLVRSVPETPFKPSTSSVEPDKSRSPKSLPPNISTKQHSAKPSEDEVLAQKDGFEPSQRGSSYNNQSVPVQTGVPASNETAKPSTSRQNSLNDSHVHPKLPDYEILADYFKSLRSNRRER